MTLVSSVHIRHQREWQHAAAGPVSCAGWKDEEDQAYLMDDAGNIEPSQESKQTSKTPGEESGDVWGDTRDDRDFLESLDEFEQNSGEIPDQILLTCMSDSDWFWQHLKYLSMHFIDKLRPKTTVVWLQHTPPEM